MESSETIIDNTQIKIKDLYKNEKSYRFILHLIRSYLPIDEKTKKVEKFIDTEQNLLKCAVTGFPISDTLHLEDFDALDMKVRQAYKGFNTDAYLCGEALFALERFTNKMVESGDKRIKFLVLGGENK